MSGKPIKTFFCFFLAANPPFYDLILHPNPHLAQLVGNLPILIFLLLETIMSITINHRSRYCIIDSRGLIVFHVFMLNYLITFYINPHALEFTQY